MAPTTTIRTPTTTTTAAATMNVVREISRINAAELDIAIKTPSASWHEQYRDSAYIFIGGLPYDLTEGDVIAIFSQYGEVVDVHLPRVKHAEDKPSDAASTSRHAATQPTRKAKHRGFGFLMYEDQRSTVLAVDNLNGAHVLGRTLRVDHVASYKQPKMRDADGQLVEPDQKSWNAAPAHMLAQQADSAADDDLEDPMAAYFQRIKDEKKRESQHADDDAARTREKEEKARRKEERARIRAEREQRRHGAHRKDEHDSQRARHTSHRSHRRAHSDSEEEHAVNRYAEARKQKSVLDDDAPHMHSSSSRHRDRDRDRDREQHPHRERRRSRSPRP